MKKLNATQIKIIAIISMTIDHIAYAFVSAGTLLHYIMHLVGKTTAPIMCFFLAEGFRHTHDKKKYLFRLLSFTVISQPVYYVFVMKAVPNNLFQFLTNMNIMFTLSLGFISLLILTNDKLSQTAKCILTAFTVSLGQFGDWGYIIPVWTIIFFFFNKDRKKMAVAFIVATVIILPLCFLKFFDSFTAFSFNYGSLLTLIPIHLYNGKRDRNNCTPLKKNINRWFFYVYYPLHMIVLIIIAQK